MEYIQDACLYGLLITSLFMGPAHQRFKFTWDKFKDYSNDSIILDNYDRTLSKFLLQLSLMVTESSYLSEPLVIPKLLEKSKRLQLLYDECPHPLISQGLPNIEINKPVMVANVFYENNILFIVFTGTVNGCMAALDLSYKQVEAEGITNYTYGCKVHRGIYLIYNSIRNKLITAIKPLLSLGPSNIKIIITGHSLGGGLSQLCALDLAYYNPVHYSFASPKIFNGLGYKTFSNLLKYSYRVANFSDLITLTPLPIMPNGDIFYDVGAQPFYFHHDFIRDKNLIESIKTEEELSENISSLIKEYFHLLKSYPEYCREDYDIYDIVELTFSKGKYKREGGFHLLSLLASNRKIDPLLMYMLAKYSFHGIENIRNPRSNRLKTYIFLINNPTRTTDIQKGVIEIIKEELIGKIFFLKQVLYQQLPNIHKDIYSLILALGAI